MTTITIKRLKEILTPQSYKSLMKFMYGQTIPLDGIYDDDFMRWVLELYMI